MSRLVSLSYRQVNADVCGTLMALLAETGRYASADDGAHLVPGLPSPDGWGERSGPSWAGFLKRVETQLHGARPEYRLLHVTATDGHRTWRLPLFMTTHLLAEKILSAERGRSAALRGRQPA